MTLVEMDGSTPEFKAALRNASASQLREAIRYLSELSVSDRRLGRLRAALRRRELHKKRQ